MMVQFPPATNVTFPPLVTVHTPSVDELKVTARPELLVAVTVGGLAVMYCEPGLSKLIVWFAWLIANETATVCAAE